MRGRVVVSSFHSSSVGYIGASGCGRRGELDFLPSVYAVAGICRRDLRPHGR